MPESSEPSVELAVPPRSRQSGTRAASKTKRQEVAASSHGLAEHFLRFFQLSQAIVRLLRSNLHSYAEPLVVRVAMPVLIGLLVVVRTLVRILTHENADRHFVRQP